MLYEVITPDAKRVLLTAYADTEAAIRAINDAQVDYYLLKPWDPPEEKLYPVLGDLLDDWGLAYRPPFEGIRRITSYNVCYTKLLRLRSLHEGWDRACGQGLADHFHRMCGVRRRIETDRRQLNGKGLLEENNGHRAKQRYRKQTGDLRNGIRITSYNVCYTKLLRPSRPDGYVRSSRVDPR